MHDHLKINGGGSRYYVGKKKKTNRRNQCIAEQKIHFP